MFLLSPGFFPTVFSGIFFLIWDHHSHFCMSSNMCCLFRLLLLLLLIKEPISGLEDELLNP